jgi:hypothetical protein
MRRYFTCSQKHVAAVSTTIIKQAMFTPTVMRMFQKVRTCRPDTLYMGTSNCMAMGPTSRLCAAVAGWSRVSLQRMASSEPPTSLRMVHCTFLEEETNSADEPGRFTEYSKATLHRQPGEMSARWTTGPERISTHLAVALGTGMLTTTPAP